MSAAALGSGLLAALIALGAPEGGGLGAADTLRPAPRPGRLLLVSVPEPRDPAILAALEPARGERIELRLGPSEGSEPTPGAPADQAVVFLRPGELETADERALEARLAAAGSIVLRGGSLLEWHAVLSPRDRATGAWRGILRAIRSGADVAGLGGGAAYLAGASLVAREELGRPVRNPRERRPFVARVGMGLGPPGIVEVEPRGDEHALRLLLELLETRASLGFRLEGESALRVDYLRGRVEILGPGRVVVLDVRGAREDRGQVRGARLSVLVAGEVWQIGHRRPLSAADARPLTRPTGTEEATRSLASVGAGLGAALEPLAGDELDRLALEGPFGRLELGLDARSRRWVRAEDTSLHGLTLAWRAPRSRAPSRRRGPP